MVWRVNVGVGPVMVGRVVGLWLKCHCRVSVGWVMVEEDMVVVDVFEEVSR